MSAANGGEPGAGSPDLLERAREQGVLSALDHRFASRIAALAGETREGVRWGLALAARQTAAGHVCADLPRLAEEGLVVEAAGEVRREPALATHARLDDWLEELRGSALVELETDAAEAGALDGDARPLVLDAAGRLYLKRAHESQAGLVDALRERAGRPDLTVDWPSAEAAIARLAPGEEPDDEWPRRALRVALARPLTIVTGGPGTGKTTMVARLTTLLVEQAQQAGAPLPRVRLLAPTGKAAAAMAAAFSRQREAATADPAVRAALPTGAETIQRALHGQTRRDAFGRPRAIRLEAEVVVVDEASMVDLALMERLFRACEEVPRVVLLGDPDQLASVESGAVLAELCAGADLEAPLPEFVGRAGPADPRAGLAESIVRLRRSHRFEGGGGIGRLAEAIRAGDADGVLALLDDPGLPEVTRVEVGEVGERDALVARLVERTRALHRGIEEAVGEGEKLARMGRYRVLCAHRRGPLGVETLGARLDEAAAALRRSAARSGWWPGRLLLVTRNAPDQDLWNGDVGLVERSGGELRALFDDGRGGVRALSAGRLPAWESAIAMSVHKSQGSEFDGVDLVLGAHPSPLMTRELLYTGVTRARERLRIHASEALLRAMLARRVDRDSGLGERIWGV